LADDLLFASQRAIPEALLASGFEFEHTTIDTALGAALAHPS
jgi:NAD dependent epimerase/dehydratase family enzyme